MDTATEQAKKYKHHETLLHVNVTSMVYQDAIDF